MTTLALLLVVLANIALNLGLIRLLYRWRVNRRRAAWEALHRGSRLLGEEVRQLAATLAHDQEVTL
jgi:hypothetical protein